LPTPAAGQERGCSVTGRTPRELPGLPEPSSCDLHPLVLALDRRACAKSMGVGIRLVDSLIAGRRGNGFPVVYINTKPVVPVDALRRWLVEQTKGGSR